MALRRDPLKRNAIPSECRKYGAELENLPHILGQCVNTKSRRIKRHDDIKDFIKKKVAKNWQILDEPRLHLQGKLLKPDLVLVNETGALVVDVTVCFEKGKYLADAAKEKIDKYKVLGPLVSSMFNRTKVEVAPIVVGSRGARIPSGH